MTRDAFADWDPLDCDGATARANSGGALLDRTPLVDYVPPEKPRIPPGYSAFINKGRTVLVADSDCVWRGAATGGQLFVRTRALARAYGLREDQVDPQARSEDVGSG